jgi:hypothetical protein
MRRQFSKINAESERELMMSYDARRADVMTVRQAEMQLDFRPRHSRDEAFYESPARSHVE